jgi:putative PIN family toxin of toxin-antitoxin system
MKLFFDTNVIIAAFISRGTCAQLLEYCLGEHSLFISEQVIDELNANLLKKFKFSKESVSQTIQFLKNNFTILKTVKIPNKICSDSSDNSILGSAQFGKVDFVISGDKDLLTLEDFEGIPIISPSLFWKYERKRLGR